MKRFKRAPAASAVDGRAAALDCIPIKNAAAHETHRGDEQVLLSYPVNVRPWLAGLVRRLGGAAEQTHIKKLQLDRLGTAVWDLLDGQRSVRQVIQRFADRYQLHPKEAEVSVTLFLKELGKRGLIGLK